MIILEVDVSIRLDPVALDFTLVGSTLVRATGKVDVLDAVFAPDPEVVLDSEVVIDGRGMLKMEVMSGAKGLVPNIGGITSENELPLVLLMRFGVLPSPILLVLPVPLRPLVLVTLPVSISGRSDVEKKLGCASLLTVEAVMVLLGTRSWVVEEAVSMGRVGAASEVPLPKVLTATNVCTYVCPDEVKISVLVLLTITDPFVHWLAVRLVSNRSCTRSN